MTGNTQSAEVTPRRRRPSLEQVEGALRWYAMGDRSGELERSTMGYQLELARLQRWALLPCPVCAGTPDVGILEDGTECPNCHGTGVYETQPRTPWRPDVVDGVAGCRLLERLDARSTGSSRPTNRGGCEANLGVWHGLLDIDRAVRRLDRERHSWAQALLWYWGPRGNRYDGRQVGPVSEGRLVPVLHLTEAGTRLFQLHQESCQCDGSADDEMASALSRKLPRCSALKRDAAAQAQELYALAVDRLRTLWTLRGAVC